MPSVSGRATNWIQTHTNQSYVTTGGGYGIGYFSIDGWDTIALHLKNDAPVNASVSVDWSYDGTSTFSSEIVVNASGQTTIQKTTTVKAPYCRLFAYNSDAATHVMNVVAFLKA